MNVVVRLAAILFAVLALLFAWRSSPTPPGRVRLAGGSALRATAATANRGQKPAPHSLFTALAEGAQLFAHDDTAAASVRSATASRDDAAAAAKREAPATEMNRFVGWIVIGGTEMSIERNSETRRITINEEERQCPAGPRPRCSRR